MIVQSRGKNKEQLEEYEEEEGEMDTSGTQTLKLSYATSWCREISKTRRTIVKKKEKKKDL